MAGVLVSIDAWDRVARARVTVRAGSARNSATMGASGFTWEPAIARRPRFSMELADEDLTGALRAGTAELVLNTNQLELVARPRELEWKGSSIRIYVGDGSALGLMTQQFVGKITSGETDATSGMVSLSCEVNRTFVDVPLLTRTYGGGGGADGEPDIRGTFKPAGFGKPINIRPVLVDSVNAVYQVDGYGNTLSIDFVCEDLASFGPSFGDYPTYAALIAASIPEGRWATSIAEGMFRLGADATGTITCDPTFGHGRPGSMMLRWLRSHAGLTDALIRVDDFAGLTAAVAAVAGHETPVSYWTTDEGNVLDLMQRMCASCNAVPLIMLDGRIGVSRVIGGAVVLDLQRKGGDPLVTAWLASDPPLPWWRLRMAAARSFYVNSPAEIDYEDDLKDMGDYRPGETYRQGMIVRSTTDGARYLFTNATQTAGVAPPAVGYWELYEDAPDATTIRYSSGATLDSKEPQEKGANITEDRVSSGFFGQGALASLNALGFGSPYLSGFGSLAGLTNLFFGSPNFLEGPGGNVASLPDFKTALGIAASIFGQGAFATVNTAAYGSNLLSGFGLLAPRSNIGFGSSYLLENDGGASATLEAFKTGLGISSGFLGQGALATRQYVIMGSAGGLDGKVVTESGFYTSDAMLITAQGIASGFLGQGALASLSAVSYGSGSLINLPRAIAPSAFFSSGFMRASEIYEDAGSANLNAYFPEDVGSNRTEVRTASGIFGQGGLATRNYSILGAQIGGIARSSDQGFHDENTLQTSQGISAGFSGQGALASRQYVLLGSSGGLDGKVLTENGFYTSDPMLITAQGVSSGFQGQGALATKNAATWATDVTGPGKPANNATSGANLFARDVERALVLAFGNNDVSVQHLTGNGPNNRDNNRIRHAPGSNAVLFDSEPIAVQPGETLYFFCARFRDGGADGGHQIFWYGYNDADVQIASDAMADTIVATQPGDTWVAVTAKMIVPDGVAKLRVGGQRLGGTTLGWWLADPYISRQQKGATLGATLGSPANNKGGDIRSVFGGELTDNDLYTSIGVSSAINGQGALATRNAADYSTQLSGLPRAIQPSAFFPSGYMYASEIYGNDGNRNLNTYFPEDVGSNRTEARVASSFVGQGIWATAGQVTRNETVGSAYYALNAFSLGYSITREDGVNKVTETLAITSLGIAAGFNGQGALATKNNVTFNDIVSTGTIISYNGQGGRIERDGNGERHYDNSGVLRRRVGFVA